MRIGDWMQTFTGKQFFPLDPRPEDICIEDIAHHLSLICRYNGACKYFYSVAEHSIRVSRHVPNEHALWGLLHDASEAYLCDLVRPIKQGIPEYAAAELRLQNCIMKWAGLPIDMPLEVKTADNRLLGSERRDLMAESPAPWIDVSEPYPEKIFPWEPKVAEAAFLARHAMLSAKQNV